MFIIPSYFVKFYKYVIKYVFNNSLITINLVWLHFQIMSNSTKVGYSRHTRGGANKTDKTPVKEYSSINLRFWNLNISLRNSHFIRDFQFQNYYQKQSIKIALTEPLWHLFLNTTCSNKSKPTSRF